MIAKREHSRAQIENKLRSKAFDTDAINAILDEMEQKNWLNDERFAEMFIHGRVSRGQGPIRIANELKVRGVNSRIIQEQLDAYDIDWLQLCQETAEKRFGSPLPNDKNDRVKVNRFLLYRGYSQSLILEVYKAYQSA
ncbi:MAG: regulatory protein RecX [Pseudomonadota bacterium]